MGQGKHALNMLEHLTRDRAFSAASNGGLRDGIFIEKSASFLASSFESI